MKLDEKIPVDFRQRDRLESLKAGLVGASALLPTELLRLSLGWLQPFWPGFTNPLALGSVLTPAVWATLFHFGETALAGFLFGVTYRYAIRQDTNPQLKTGTVLAFALARGLGQADIGWQLSSNWHLWIGGAIESVGLFAIAALLLNTALQKGWIASAPGQEDRQEPSDRPGKNLDTP
ncbi:hypothetical protein [Vacuolonema iberomarrocanum]|uniref:hypothetical protein n=1 Tax=Vacuolonema iberomarrocanum TaxID=3454632 RepID=UPI001A09E451|nr:hypothetical protein [filamentous cyanobacterium LEGE 07170]